MKFELVKVESKTCKDHIFAGLVYVKILDGSQQSLEIVKCSMEGTAAIFGTKGEVTGDLKVFALNAYLEHVREKSSQPYVRLGGQ